MPNLFNWRPLFHSSFPEIMHRLFNSRHTTWKIHAGGASRIQVPALEGSGIHTIRILHHDTHCPKYNPAYDEGKFLHLVYVQNNWRFKQREMAVSFWICLSHGIIFIAIKLKFPWLSKRRPKSICFSNNWESTSHLIGSLEGENKDSDFVWIWSWKYKTFFY